MPIAVTLVGSDDRDLLTGLRERGFRAASVALADLGDDPSARARRGRTRSCSTSARCRACRGKSAQAKRQFPTTGVVIVARALEPTEMLEAMRMGVNEWVAEPLNLDELDPAHRTAWRARSPSR